MIKALDKSIIIEMTDCTFFQPLRVLSKTHKTQIHELYSICHEISTGQTKIADDFEEKKTHSSKLQSIQAQVNKFFFFVFFSHEVFISL